jgi:hypothetical protein
MLSLLSQERAKIGDSKSHRDYEFKNTFYPAPMRLQRIGDNQSRKESSS